LQRNCPPRPRKSSSRLRNCSVHPRKYPSRPRRCPARSRNCSSRLRRYPVRPRKCPLRPRKCASRLRRCSPRLRKCPIRSRRCPIPSSKCSARGRRRTSRPRRCWERRCPQSAPSTDGADATSPARHAARIMVWSGTSTGDGLGNFLRRARHCLNSVQPKGQERRHLPKVAGRIFGAELYLSNPEPKRSVDGRSQITFGKRYSSCGARPVRGS